MQQRRAPVLEATDQEDIEERGDVRLAHTGRFLGAHGLRNGDQVAGVGGRVFGVATAGDQAHHPIADLPARDLGAELFDSPGDLETENL